MFNFNTFLDIPIYLFTIEGNIGAGKSTLIKNIENKITNKEHCLYGFFYYFIDEPIETWTQESKEDDGTITNPLKSQYDNPEKRFFSFQIVVLQSYYDKFRRKLKNIKQLLINNNIDFGLVNGIILICDRSPFTMKKIFYDGLCKYKGKNENWEIKAYNKMYDTWFENFFIKYYIIYVNTHTYQCYENKNGRNRQGEEVVSLEFLNVLDLYTLKYIDECKEKNIPILYYSFFNGNHIEEIFTFINKNIKQE